MACLSNYKRRAPDREGQKAPQAAAVLFAWAGERGIGRGAVKAQGRAFCMGRGEGASRAKVYKMHKGVFGENVQNSKIKSQNAQSLHAPVRTIKSLA